MKKSIALLLVCILCLACAGCFGGYSGFPTNNEEYIEAYVPELIDATEYTGPNIREEAEEMFAAIDEIMNQDHNNQTEADPNAHVHQFSPPTCTDWGKCECGTVNIDEPILGHDYSEPTCTDPKICRRCGKTTGRPADHQYSNGYCIYCFAPQDGNSSNGNNNNGNNSGNNGGSNTHVHNYAPATCTDPQVCACGAAQGAALGHNYVNGKCSRCGLASRTYLIEDIDYLSSDGVHYNTNRQQDNEGNDMSGHYHFYDLDLLSGPESIDFHIDGNYSQFCGTIFLPYDDRGSDNTSTISIYGDGKLLYQSQDIEKLFETENFSIDVRGVSVLMIEFNGMSYSLGCLTNAYLT